MGKEALEGMNTRDVELATPFNLVLCHWRDVAEHQEMAGRGQQLGGEERVCASFPSRAEEVCLAEKL